MIPELNNIIVSLASVIYVFLVVGIMDYFVRKGFPQDISRKIVHISAASWIIFWVFLDYSSWTKYFNIAPALIWFVLLIIKGFTAGPEDNAVKTMTRTGDRRELLKGPLYFTLVMIIAGTVFLNDRLAVISMGILGWGDGLAPIFGKRFGKHKYNIVTEKSFEGSASFFIFGFIGVLLFSYFLNLQIDMLLIILCVVSATLVEAISPKDIDNVLIPATCTLIFYLF